MTEDWELKADGLVYVINGDLGYSEALGEKGSEAYAAGAVLGSVCHGALGLLNMKDETGNPLVQGLNVTGVCGSHSRRRASCHRAKPECRGRNSPEDDSAG